MTNEKGLRKTKQSLKRMKPLDIEKLVSYQRSFVAQRKWKRFHTPKNLSMALSVEASELMEIFQWLSQAEGKKVMCNPAKAKAVSHEMDVHARQSCVIRAKGDGRPGMVSPT